jgi:hypothetical protein
MIFEGLDSAFGAIAAMIVGRHQLVVNSFLSEVTLEAGRGFVVEAHMVWCKALIDEIIMEEVEGAEMFSFGIIFHGTGENGIAVIDIAYKNVAMSKTQRDGKLAC